MSSKLVDADSKEDWEKQMVIADDVRKVEMLLGKDVGARKWIVTPHPELNNQRPLDAIREGRTEEVIALISSR